MWYVLPDRQTDVLEQVTCSFDALLWYSLRRLVLQRCRKKIMFFLGVENSFVNEIEMRMFEGEVKMCYKVWQDRSCTGDKRRCHCWRETRSSVWTQLCQMSGKPNWCQMRVESTISSKYIHEYSTLINVEFERYYKTCM